MGALLRRKTAYDPWFLFAAVTLISFGLVMVTSASLSFSESMGFSPWHFAVRHALYLASGLIFCIITTYMPIAAWRLLSAPLLLITMLLLVALLIPGVSREINGSVRWLFIGPITIQVSECAKLALIIYMAKYLVQHETEVQTEISGFLRPMALLGVITLLLLSEPDFGAAVVIVSTIIGMLFLAGVPFKRFFVLLLIVLLCLGVLSVASPYRIQRLTSFLDPWSDQFKSGYQLTQALIAFGKGGWFGAGLGNSVQKLLYLPEPHNDFIYAVIAEELGLVGALFILLLFCIFVWRALSLGRRAILMGKKFAGFIAYGIGLWIGIQTLINIGVNVGVLPTKGLTLPLMSYGGSSMIIAMIAIGMLLRIEFELALKNKS